MLRLAARHADAWNTAWYGVPDDRLARQLAAFNEALEDEGRDPGTMAKTVGMVVRDPGVDAPAEENEFAGSVEELSDAIEAYARLGIDHLIVLLQPMTEPSLDRLGAALERRADLSRPAPSEGGCGVSRRPGDGVGRRRAGQRRVGRPRSHATWSCDARATPSPENALGRLGHAPEPRLRPDPEAFVPLVSSSGHVPSCRSTWYRSCVSPEGSPDGASLRETGRSNGCARTPS